MLHASLYFQHRCSLELLTHKKGAFMLKRKFEFYKQINPHELDSNQLKELEKEILKPDKNIMSDQYLDFLLWCKGLPSRQESLANFIEKKLSKYPGAKILEVGCGRTARLSRILSKQGFNMTCIDSVVEPSLVENVTAIKGLFNHKTFDLSEYDFVIAQEPCDATEHVVLACTKQNKPFFMSLCGVPHKRLSGGMPKTYEEWYNHLLKVSDGKAKLIYLSLDPLSRTPILKSKTGF